MTSPGTGTFNGVLIKKNISLDYTNASPGTVAANPIFQANGDLMIGSTANPNIAALRGHLTSTGGTITVSYVAPNINLEAVASTDLHVAKYIVGSGSSANYTTIASAVAAAPTGSIIYIQEGSYTENVTITKSLSFYSMNAEFRAGTQNTIVMGKFTVATNSINVSFFGIQFNTNSDYSFTFNASSSNITCQNCYFNASNNTSIQCTGATSSDFLMENCTGNLASGYALFTTTNTFIWLKNCLFYDASSPAASTTSAGSVTAISSTLNFPFTTTSTGTLSLTYCQLGANSNTTYVTTAGTGSATIDQCIITSNTSSAISVGTGTIVNCYNTIISSSNTNAITGAGTLNYGNITFSGSSSTINTTTTVPVAFPVLQGGTGLTSTTINQLLYSSATNTIAGLSTGNNGVLITSAGGVPSISSTLPSAVQGNITSAGAVTLTSVNFGGTTLSVYAEGTWTPTFLGHTTAGTTTYNNQTGYYTKIGNLVFVQCYVNVATMTGTGLVVIGGLPFTVKNQTDGYTTGSIIVESSGFVWPVGSTQLSPNFRINTTTAWIEGNGSAFAGDFLAATNAGIDFYLNACYRV